MHLVVSPYMCACTRPPCSVCAHLETRGHDPLADKHLHLGGPAPWGRADAQQRWYQLTVSMLVSALMVCISMVNDTCFHGATGTCIWSERLKSLPWVVTGIAVTGDYCHPTLA